MKALIITLFYLSIFNSLSYSQRVGVNASTPSDALHVVGAATDNPLRVQVGTATKLRVLNNGGTSIGINNTTGTPANGLYVDGNTGLGVNSPTDKLAVAGNLNITGEIKANGISGQNGQTLQANGDGSMSWANPYGYKNFIIFDTPHFNPQSWQVPAGVTEIMVELWGAGGGGSTNYGGGAGAYVKFKRNVTPGATLNFNVGERGFGKTNLVEATDGGDTTFPINASNDNYAGGGQSGVTGFGGASGIFTYFTTNYIGLVGDRGGLPDHFYFQISTNVFATKTVYGSGGRPFVYGSMVSNENGAKVFTNTTTNAQFLNVKGGDGFRPSGGGGGGPAVLSANGGGNGANGQAIIYW